jgi:hypothetical protein
VRLVRHRVVVLATHHVVVRENEGVIVRADDVVGVVAKIASDAVELFRQAREIHRAVGLVLVDGHRRVALDAELPDVCRLAALVEREEQRIVGGVRVHAGGPLLIVLWVAVLAGLRVFELLDGEVRHRDRGSGRSVGALTARHQRDGCPSISKQVHR